MGTLQRLWTIGTYTKLVTLIHSSWDSTPRSWDMGLNTRLQCIINSDIDTFNILDSAALKRQHIILIRPSLSVGVARVVKQLNAGIKLVPLSSLPPVQQIYRARLNLINNIRLERPK